MRFPKLVKRIEEREAGQVIPWYWGMAYCDVLYLERVVAIIPLNFVIAAARELWFRMRIGLLGRGGRGYLERQLEPRVRTIEERSFERGRFVGRREGLREGFEDGWEQRGRVVKQSLEEEIERMRQRA